MIENKDRVMTQAKANRDLDETKDCTFKPQLLTKKSNWSRNESKRRAVSQLEVKGSQQQEAAVIFAPRYEELYEKGKIKEEKLRLIREDKKRRESMEHKFKPKINQKSKDIVKARLAQYTMQSAVNLAVVADKRIVPESTKNKLSREINTSSGLRSVSFGDM